MTKNPKTLTPDLLVPTAIEMLHSSSIMSIFVVEEKRPVGLGPYARFLASGRCLITHIFTGASWTTHWTVLSFWDTPAFVIYSVTLIEITFKISYFSAFH